MCTCMCGYLLDSSELELMNEWMNELIPAQNGCWDLSSVLMIEQQVLLTTEISLQILLFVFIEYFQNYKYQLVKIPMHFVLLKIRS